MSVYNYRNGILSSSTAISPPPILRSIVFYNEINLGDVEAAWGLRKLVSSYTGNLVRIRDTDDDSEQDVGFDSDGLLATFSVVGNAAITQVYDQSGNDDYLEQTVAANQPLLQRSIITGRWEVKFDGSNDHLRSRYTSVSVPAGAWAIARPIYFWRGTGYGAGGENFGAWWAIVHNDGEHSSPWYRTAMQRDGTVNTRIQLWRANPSGLGENSTSNPRYDRSHGIIAWHPYADHVTDLSPRVLSAPGAANVEVTYPSTSRVYMSADGTGAGSRVNSSFEEFVIVDGNGHNAAALDSAMDLLYEENKPAATGVILDMPFTTALGVADQSDYDHVLNLMGPSAPSADYLAFNGSTDRAAIAQHASLALGANFRIEFDVYFTALGTDKRILSCHAAQNHQLGWEISTWDAGDDELMFIVESRTVAANYVVTGSDGPALDMVTATWYSVVIERASGTITIDVDGVEKASKAVSKIGDSGGILTLGADINTDNNANIRLRNLKITRNA